MSAVAELLNTGWYFMTIVLQHLIRNPRLARLQLDAIHAYALHIAILVEKPHYMGTYISSE